ncbi:hypothetical protein Zmor_025695 [Zophobas morio]|uniref:Uncharacterized protein n=1 Tax=Zophobas morio TaxID=2755281 RepID=A0AA38M3Z2_9CUCU|nr:hypothetical protein Zmor_025695 [Zophobas morio]
MPRHETYSNQVRELKLAIMAQSVGFRIVTFLNRTSRQIFGVARRTGFSNLKVAELTLSLDLGSVQTYSGTRKYLRQILCRPGINFTHSREIATPEMTPHQNLVSFYLNRAIRD